MRTPIKSIYICFVEKKPLSLSTKLGGIMETTDVKDKIEYVVAAISEFGKRHGLTHVEAYRYLKRFKGLEMLYKFYDVMHTLSFKNTTDGLTAFCHRHGGALI